LNPALQIDGYKVDHRRQYPVLTEMVYSNFTPRKTRIQNIDKIAFFGLQYFIKKYLIEDWKRDFFDRPRDEIVNEYRDKINAYIGPNQITFEHIGYLHDLGYLPILIKAVPEGFMGDINVPLMTIRNTDPKCFWLVNYLETILSACLWKPCTSATIAAKYRQTFEQFAEKTCDDNALVPFQGHDFSFRGMSGLEDAMVSGAAHLLSFVGTDTIPAIDFLEKYYGADRYAELVGCSVAATEHSVQCLNGAYNGRTYEGTEEERLVKGEFELFERLITETYPSGILSIVSDTWDFWGVVTEYLPALRGEIIKRHKKDGFSKVVIRPDSGDPYKIICGEYIRNYDDAVDIEELKEYVLEDVLEKVVEETPHGECGPPQIVELVKWNGKHYNITIDIEWNRYDKQYYYIEAGFSKVTNCAEVEVLPEQKGLIECLWDIFGGTINNKGYKVLNPAIGAIYGDSITLDIQRKILEGLERNGFASNNMVFGIGSYTYQYVTRDTFGFVMKATYGEVDGEGYNIHKTPKTGAWKTSHKGLMCLTEEGLKQECSWEEEANGIYEEVFKDGQLLREQTLAEIRQTLMQNLIKNDKMGVA